MHENREISSTLWSCDQGRSAKAMKRTADTHALEKSDCAVVPVNQPNKGGQPPAEVGEGRAQTEGNIVRSHMPPTQSGTRMSQGLDGVRIYCGTASRQHEPRVDDEVHRASGGRSPYASPDPEMAEGRSI